MYLCDQTGGDYLFVRFTEGYKMCMRFVLDSALVVVL